MMITETLLKIGQRDKENNLQSQRQFNYVFNFTDHLGNIRLKYTEHPQTGETEILEENHYYPYGLTHQGYNGGHLVVGLEQPGTPITLIPVTPGVIDTYKYKFGGMEYSDEFDINTYDFGARNYDPALGRWMNIDPLAEMMRRHSPYNYAFNNPIYFIDPDGMMPGGFANTNSITSTGAFDSIGGGGGGFDVRTFDADGNTLDFVSVGSGQGVDITADGSISANDMQTSDIGGAMGGGGCPPGVDCGGEMQRGNTPIPVGDFSNSGGNSGGTSSSSNESAASLISKVTAINYEISGESVFDTAFQESYESGGDIFYAGQWALFVNKISSGGDIGGSSPGGGGKTVSGLKKRGASGNLQTIRVSGKNKTVHTGSQGGKYYINDNGNKTYLNRDGTKRN